MGAGESVDMEKYSDDWFRAEFPEYIGQFTFKQWFDFFRRHARDTGMGLTTVARAAREAVRIYGAPVQEVLSGENEFGPVSP